jgi:PleD family two-component response regulator
MPTPCTLLYAESDADLARQFQRHMESHQIDAIFAASDMAGISALSRHRVDLIVANYRLSGGSGLVVLRAARKSHPGLAALLLVEPADLKQAGQALREEHFDYLVKDADGVYLDLLPQMATRLIGQHNQQAALDSLSQALEQAHALALEAAERNEHGLAIFGPDRRQSNMDALTGLPGRPLFMELLKHQVRRGSRSGYNGAALLLLDIDGFKLLNQSHGNAICDLVLVEVARRLSGAVRE